MIKDVCVLVGGSGGTLASQVSRLGRREAVCLRCVGFGLITTSMVQVAENRANVPRKCTALCQLCKQHTSARRAGLNKYCSYSILTRWPGDSVRLPLTTIA